MTGLSSQIRPTEEFSTTFSGSERSRLCARIASARRSREARKGVRDRGATVVEQAFPMARGGSNATAGLPEDVGGCPPASRLPQDGVPLGEGRASALSGHARRAPTVPAERDREVARTADLPRRVEGLRGMRSPAPQAPTAPPKSGAPPVFRGCTRARKEVKADAFQ